MQLNRTLLASLILTLLALTYPCMAQTVPNPPPQHTCKFDFVVTTNHISSPSIRVINLTAGGPYWLTGSNVSVSVSGEAVTNVLGKHEIIGTPTPLYCDVVLSNGVCGAKNPYTATYDTKAVAPDSYTYDWTLGANPKVPGSGKSFSGTTTVSTPGTNTLTANYTGTVANCTTCTCYTSGTTNCTVYQLTFTDASLVSSNLWVGLDRTDSGPTNQIRFSEVKLVPDDPAKYLWEIAGVCILTNMVGKKTEYWAMDKDACSASYLNEKLTCTATVTNPPPDFSLSVSTNFTIVKVDVSLAGLVETNEETVGAFLAYREDADGGIPEGGTNGMIAISITCTPGNLPSAEMVAVSFPVGSLFEMVGETLVEAQTNYPTCEISSKQFFLHGHAVSSGLKADSITATHGTSEAVDKANFTVWDVDLDVDTDRDGDIAEADDEGEDVWTILRGALAHPYLVDLYTTQDAPHTNLSRIAIACSSTLQGITFRLKAVDSETKDLMTFVDEGGMGIGFDSNSMIDIPCCPTNLYVAAPEPRKTSGNMPVRFTVDLEALYMGQVIAKDRVLLAVTPVILPPECNEAETVYASSTNLLASIPGLELIPSVVDIWTQDQVKFVKTQHAAGANNDLAVTLSHPDTANLEYVLRHTNKMPYCQWPVNGQGGNMMATPPLGADAPYGKLMLGTKNLQSQSRWVAQGIQPVVEISNDWLLVGHVDEILMWSATDKVLFADPWKAADLLHGEIAAGRGSSTIWWGTKKKAQRDTEILGIVTDNYKIGQIASALPASADPTNVVFSVPLFVAGDILRVDNEIFALQSVSANGLTGTVERAQADRPAATHTNGSMVYAFSAVMKKNLIGTDSVTKRISTATNQLKQAIGNYQADFVPVPVLFSDDYIDSSNRVCFAAQTANMVNSLVLNSQSAYYSNPGNAVFRDYFESVVPGASAIDIWYNYHCGFGEIHCGTAVRRVLSAQPPWWEQNVQQEEWEDMP